jgi:hypothetical protein
MIRQSAVGVGDIFPALEDDDLRSLIQPAQTRRTARAARYSADDHYLFSHYKASLSMFKMLILVF